MDINGGIPGFGDLIDVVHKDTAQETTIWSKLNVEDDRKRMVFREALYGHFDCTHLSTDNLVKLTRFIVRKRSLTINLERFVEVLSINKLSKTIIIH